jgi:glutaminyl-peptide cyclotransferase
MRFWHRCAAGLLAAWIAVLAGCGPAVEPLAERETRTSPSAAPGIELSGERALDEVRRFVALGPRDSGTPGAERAATYLLERFGQLGIDAEIEEFEDASPQGQTVFRNVVGKLPGKTGGILMFGSHYDTKSGIDDFEGANDSGSSTGLLFELARTYAAGAPHALEIWFVHFDGEECMVEYGKHDGLHGSRRLAETMEADGSLRRVAALILLDMVGDRNLTITFPRNGTPELTSMAFDAARELGVRRHFQLYRYPILDDHVPFYERGVRAINFIDFHYGSMPGSNDHWHTAEDSMDKLSAESLETVGRVAQRLADQILAGR